MLTNPLATLMNGASGHSAKVELWLEIPGRRISLTHAASAYVVTSEALNLPPCEGKVIYTVDGQRVECPVRLVNGFSETIRKTEIAFLPVDKAIA